MLIGLTIDSFKGIAPSTLLKLARHVGVNFVEITHSVFDDLPAVLTELGSIKTGFHLPNFGDHGIDFSHRKYRTDIDLLIDQVNKHHKALNVQYCLAHPPEGHANDEITENSISYLFENLQKLTPPLVVENIQSLSFDAFQYFYALAKGELGDKLVGQCYDPAHYFVSGEDPLAVLDQMKVPIATVHLSDCRPDKDSHLPFGMGGVLPVDAILSKLRQKNYQNPINMELLPRSMDDIIEVVESYLQVVKVFEPWKYRMRRVKMKLLLPLLQRKLSSYGSSS